jgi:hypothetical protein
MLLHDEIFRVLESEELTGWTRIPAQLQFRDGSISDEYAELHIAGFGGIVPETSGNKLLWRCRGCGVREYAGTLRGAEIEKIIDWDGSDFFKVWPAMAMSFCTDRARGVLERCAPELEFSPMSAQADVTSYGDGNIPPYHPDNVRRKIEAYWAAAPVWPDDFPNTPSKPDVASPPAG